MYDLCCIGIGLEGWSNVKLVNIIYKFSMQGGHVSAVVE